MKVVRNERRTFPSVIEVGKESVEQFEFGIFRDYLNFIRIPVDVSDVVSSSGICRCPFVDNARVVKMNVGRRFEVDVPAAEDLTEFFMEC